MGDSEGVERKVLTPGIIAGLDGRPIRLSSPHAEGKLLSVSATGKTSLKPSQKGHQYGQYWSLVPTRGGFEIISSRTDHKICHYPEKGGDVSTRVAPLGADSDCVWKIGKEGEIYQPDSEGGERYLWLAKDKLYVTRDGFLAERWTPLKDGEAPPNSRAAAITWFFAIVIVIAIAFLYLCKRSP